MPTTLPLLDAKTRDDLRIYLERLSRSGEDEVRLTSRGRALAVYGCTQAPLGITDPVPVVLVMRGFALADEPADPVDTTVLVRSLLDRLARRDDRSGEDSRADPPRLDLPDVTAMGAWAGVLPPVSGWRSAGLIDAPSLREAARQGIERVAGSLPADPGEAVVHRVRASVWGAEIAPGLPAAAAFAAETMGFLRDEDHVRVSRSLTWTRLTTSRGTVLVRSLLG